MFSVVQQGSPPQWWSRLSAGETLFSDPRWLALFGRSRGETETWWFGAGRSDRAEIGIRGNVVGADARKSMNPYRWLFERTAYHDGEPFDAGRAPDSQTWFPALVCSYPGLESYPVGAGVAGGDSELVRLLLDGIAGWARDRRIGLVVVGFVQPERQVFGTAAAMAGYRPVPVATRASLRIDGRGPDQVFDLYSAGQRNNLRRLRARLATRGIRVVELADPVAELDTLVALRCAHMRQHGREPDEVEERTWLGLLLTELGDRVTVYGAIEAGELRGFSLFVHDGQWWHAFVVARRDPERDRDVYFELMYHTPTEQAAARGIAEISFGYGTEEAKRRRGCTLVRVPAWFLSTEPEVHDWLAKTAASAGD